MKARSKKTILKNKITKEKKDMNKNKKAQVSIEMIIILSVLILGAVVLASLLLGFFNKSVDTNVDIDAQTGNTVNSFINDLVNYNDSNNDDTPTPTPLSYNLTLTPNNPSFGSAQTSGSYQAGSLVTVTASPNTGYTFNNWTVTSTSVVASSSSSYSFNMPSNDLALTANFSLTPPTNCTLSLSRNPHFGGTTTGQGTYVCNSSVTATATPVINYQFVNWTTPTGTVTTNPYTFNLTSNQVFTANFSPSAYALNLTKAGSGNGTVTSNPAGISCTSSCTSDSHTFNVNQPVTLTATAVSGHSFAGWSGDCTGTSPTCTVTMDAVKNVTATFNLPNTYLLSVAKENPLGGEVFSSGPTLGIICGATCSASYSNGTAVSLTATPAIGYTFVEWRGDCTGATCSLTMNSSKDVNAVFAPIYHNLNINKVNGNYGFVNSLNPNPGIICGSDCTEGYFYGTNVTLSASGLNGGTFAGWSGAGCSGTGTCTVTMDSPKLVTATFNPPVVNYLLSVNKTGTGSGNVVASTVGIDCGGTCSYSYNQGSLVTLNATADAGSSFSGWSGAGCSGTGTCMVTMDAAKSVTATFNLNTYNVSLAVNPSGIGTVTGAGNYTPGTIVTVNASNGSSGYYFDNWSGSGVSGSSNQNYSFTMPANNVSLTANYINNYQLRITRVPFSSGFAYVSAINGIPTVGGYEVTPGTLQNYFQSGSTLTVTATGNSGYAFTNWTGPSNNFLSSSNVYSFVMPSNNYQIYANFNPAITINISNPTSNQQFPPYYTHPTDGTGIRLMASISGSSASNSEFYKVWEYTRNMVNWPTWVSFNSGNTGNSSSAYALYIPTQTGTYYFRLKYTDDNYPGSTFYSNVVQVNVVSLP